MKPCLNGYIFLIIDFNSYTEIFPQWKFLWQTFHSQKNLINIPVKVFLIS